MLQKKSVTVTAGEAFLAQKPRRLHARLANRYLNFGRRINDDGQAAPLPFYGVVCCTVALSVIDPDLFRYGLCMHYFTWAVQTLMTLLYACQSNSLLRLDRILEEAAFPMLCTFRPLLKASLELTESSVWRLQDTPSNRPSAQLIHLAMHAGHTRTGAIGTL